MKHAPAAGGVTIVVILVAVLVWFIRGFMATKEQKPQRAVQTVTLIRPPPPPPPEEKPPPPPEKIDQPLPKDTPEPTPRDTPAPAPQLGLDTSGEAGSDAFGLMARQGGADLVGTGNAVFAWYTSKLKDQVAERLSTDATLRAKKYSVTVHVWIAADGRIRDVRLLSTTGNHELDTAIVTDLSSMGRMSEAPPIEMPQPVRLQIVSRT